MSPIARELLHFASNIQLLNLDLCFDLLILSPAAHFPQNDCFIKALKPLIEGMRDGLGQETGAKGTESRL